VPVIKRHIHRTTFNLVIVWSWLAAELGRITAINL
jgi:hypothetical protein